VSLHVGLEPVLPLLTALALIGSVALVRRRQPFLAAWFLVTAFVEPRSSIGVGVPLAIAAGVGIDALAAVRLAPPLRAAVAGPTVAFVVMSAIISGVSLHSVSPEARTHMRWIDGALPRDARVLVMSGVAEASIDAASEWFSAIAHRTSVATSQGREWLIGAYAPVVKAHADVQRCETAACLDDWTRRTGITFDYVFFATSGEGVPCCAGLRAEIDRATGYALVHETGLTSLYLRAAARARA
jgi:hypothetical protein